MSRRYAFVAPTVAAVGIFVASPVQAATPNPTDEIKTVFAKGNVSTLCAADDALRDGPLIGELSSAYKLNAFALPSVPAAATIPAPNTVEGRTAAWIVYRQQPEFQSTGLTDAQADALEAIGTDLSDYVVWLAGNTNEPFMLAPGASVPDLAGAIGAERTRQRAGLLALLLKPLLSSGQPASLLLCRRSADQIAKPDRPVKSSEGGSDHFVIAVRGKIDDLAVPRNDPGTHKPGAAFKSASAASVAFTDNHQKGETSVAIDATVGVGRQIGRSDALFLFVRYAQTSTETRDAADDDDSKDIRALSPGLLYRHNTRIGGVLYGTLGLTAYPTFDFAQDARTGRVRLFVDDIALSGIGRGPLCGRADRIGGLEISCRAGLFAEGAHVWRAGRSTDLATLEDDEYFGIGASLKLGLSLPEVAALKPFSVTGEYRYMAIVSGALADPHRLSLALNYKLTEANLTFGIGYDEGSNFDTFQRERITKVTLGYKY